MLKSEEEICTSKNSAAGYKCQDQTEKSTHTRCAAVCLYLVVLTLEWKKVLERYSVSNVNVDFFSYAFLLKLC